MRFLRGNSIRFIVLPVLLAVSFILLPLRSHARDESLVKTEIQAVYDTGQFGEPGHDPFLNRHQPGGQGFNGGNGGGTLIGPDSDQNGEGPSGPLASGWDIEVIIRVLGETLGRAISQLF
ncbi:MAG: hypothetical protein KAV42_07780 [Candidatus Krumholzibacteria bacterium]|nr:hypothetical protein [Candidatus Krumholzibacteria bacterium]